MSSPARTVWLWKTALKQLEELPANTATDQLQQEPASASGLQAADEFFALPKVNPAVWPQLFGPDLKVWTQ